MTYHMKQNKQELLFALVISFFVISIFVVPSAHAVSISPLTFDITVDPGQVITNFLTVYNNTQSAGSFTIEAEDFSPIGETGGVAITSNVPEELSAKGWLSFEPASFSLEPGGSKDVQFTLKVPLDANPGGKYTSILVSSAGGSTGGPSVTQKVANLLLIKVTGPVEENLRVQSFEAPNFLENGPVPFSLRIQNGGTVHLRPAGFIFVTSWWGGEQAKIPVPQARVIPKTVRALDLSWDQKWLFGKYTASFAGIYGSTNEPLAATKTFWVVPWKPLSIALAVLVVLLAIFIRIRHRLALATRILIKGK